MSSSGHLSLFQHFTGQSGEGALLFSAILHLGTLVAVFVAFRDTIWALIKEFFVMLKDIFTGKFKWSTMNGERRMIIMLVISLAMLIPFYIFKDFFTGIAEDSDILVEGVCFLYTSLILYLSDRQVKKHYKEPKDITVKDAVVVGAFQGVALLPGVSRSGSTIAGGLFSGFSRELAIRYSFILGIPAILGGCLLEIKDAFETGFELEVVPFVVGFIVAGVVGICAIKMVSWLMKSDKFKIFAYYTLALGIVVTAIGIFEKIVGMNFVDYIKM